MTPSVTLASPDWHTAPVWSSTLGPEVADLCEMVGLVPHPEQRMVLDDVFALDGSGRSVAFETGVIAPRQQLKTTVLEQCALGWLFLTDQPLVIWSAHEFGTAQEAFRDLHALIDGSDMLSRRVRKITTGNGDEAIELTTGARLKFKARTSGGGRGLTGHKVILDEAFALAPEHMGALLPTLIAVPDPQVVYASSAGMANSGILRALRDRGRTGGKRLAYLEWGTERRECASLACTHTPGTSGCVLDDVDLWRQACPVTARSDPTMAPIRALRNALPADMFARECLGWWDDPSGESVVSAALWEECLDLGSKMVGRPEFALDVSPTRSWAAIAVAGKRGDGVAHVEVTSNQGVIDHREGVEWVLPRLGELHSRWPNFKIWLPAGSAAESLIPGMTAAGISVDVVKVHDFPAACGLFYDLCVGRAVRHVGQPDLTEALMGAAQVNVADGAWKWARRRSSTDITALYAATTALWVAHQRRTTPNVW